MAKKESIKKAAWDKQFTRHFAIKLNNNTDADIIAWLEAQPSMQGAIKAAVRAYMEKEEQKQC